LRLITKFRGMEKGHGHQEEHREIEFAYMTRENMLYNLTPFNQKRLRIPFVQLQSSDLLPIADVIEKMPPSMSLKQFVGFPDHAVYLTTIDPSQKLTRGSNDKKAISIKSRKSYTTLSNEQFLTFASRLNPEVMVALSEEKVTDPKMQEGKKSDRRAMTKMLNFLDEAIALKKGGKLVGTKILAPIIDTIYSDVRQDLVKAIMERRDSIGGVVVYGLNDLPSQPVSGDHKTEVLRDLSVFLDKEFTKHKLVVSSTLGDPIDVLRKVNLGFNFFESDYPFYLAEKGQALNFWPEEWYENHADYDGYKDFLEGGRLKDDLDVYHRKVPLLDLKNLEYMNHKDSIFPTYHNYPFKGYSKAYICHLLNNDEMTGNVLLTLHNCFIYQEFFKIINRKEFLKNSSALIYAFCRFICT
jgi:tRNA-guanine family transglycosylase